MKSIEIILTDLHYWEGPRGVKDLTAVCRTFNLGVAMHSGAEFGIESVSYTHIQSLLLQKRFIIQKVKLQLRLLRRLLI